MAKYIGFRLLATIPLVFAVLVVTFLISVAMEANGSIAAQVCGEGATPECIGAVEAELGLNDPIIERFFDWFSSVLRGDLGSSLLDRNTSVGELIGERIWPTLSIVGFSLLIGVTLGMLLGVVAAIRPGGLLDRVISVGAAGVIAAPGFIIGMLLSWGIAVELGWLDPVGYVSLSESFTGWLKSITLPAIALSLPTLAIVQRQLRGSMANALQSRYVLAARARGVGRTKLISRHALPNALVPTVTVIGFRAAAAIGLTTAVEIVFGIRGMGEMLVSAIVNRNVTVLQGGMIVVGLVVAFVNLLVDISYGYLNPKVRLDR
ncbi:MAG: ABC transporter permease [Acidimicrobiia bacterium]|nr:ABC transporter permease [Acidimicrobiia bacterium]